MSTLKVPQVVGPIQSGSIEGAKEKFGKVLEGVTRQKPSEVGPMPVADARPVDASCNPSVNRAAPGRAEVKRSDAVRTSGEVQASKVLDQVTAAQRRLDQVLALAQSGKTFTPAELLAMQAQVYRASQELDLAGKVVEKATAGVKQVLQTQL